MLLKKQRNDLFDILLNVGLIPSDFTEHSNMSEYTIGQNGTSFSFKLSASGTNYKPEVFPRIDLSRLPSTGSVLAVGWSRATNYFKEWAAILKEEQDTPDRFAEFRKNVALFIGQANAPDEKFNSIELRELGSQLRQIEAGFSLLGLPANAQKLLVGVTQEATEKASRFTKKEWQSWFIGAVVSQVTNLALSPEHVAAVYQLLKSTFTSLLQLH